MDLETSLLILPDSIDGAHVEANLQTRRRVDDVPGSIDDSPVKAYLSTGRRIFMISLLGIHDVSEVVASTRATPDEGTGLGWEILQSLPALLVRTGARHDLKSMH